MDFSAQLEELQRHAAAAKETAMAAAKESRDQLKPRLDQAQADVASAAEQAGRGAGREAADVKAKWAKMKADMSAHRQDVKMRMDKMANQVDATLAEADAEWADAEWAEADAANAIYAEWVIDNARVAVLNAIDVRAYADELATSSK